MTHLIIDSHAICHQAKHSTGELSHNDIGTGIVFGFFKQIYSLAVKFKTNKFVFAWDSKTSKRKSVYPMYKSNRKERNEEEKIVNQIAFEQFNEIKTEILPKLGFINIFEEEGYEADDIIASILWNKNGEIPCIIVSSDTDLYQLLDKAPMYSTRKKELYTNEMFSKEWGVIPMDWSQIKAIAGCSSDGVPGIPRIGEKTAIKFLRGELSAQSNPYKLLTERDSKEIISRNLSLVKLPFLGMKKIKIKEEEEVLSQDAFIEMFNTKGFNSLITKEAVTQWKKTLQLQ
jgi:DNA polymerase-1